MGKRFNTTGICYPDEHYMVNMQDRLRDIETMVAAGEYFTINRARQYGKTTLLNLLEEKLAHEYTVLSISFEGMGNDAYVSESAFCQSICRLLARMVYYKDKKDMPPLLAERLKLIKSEGTDMIGLSDLFSELCGQMKRPVILIIDEVDQASDKEVFLSFLGMLRDKYLQRKKLPAFQTVILASVYDIKNLKLKVRPQSEHHYNSPWNIACDFGIDMSFSAEDIAGMLEEYERDYHTQMDVRGIAELICDYTCGYPFLVSRLCKIADERISVRAGFSKSTAWTHSGIVEAVKELLAETNTLFDDMIKKTEDFPELKKTLYAILFRGEIIPYNSDYYVLNTGILFGFLKNKDGIVAVANRIFETRFYNLFLAEELLDSKIYKAGAMEKSLFVENGQLNMELVLEKFTEAFTDIYYGMDEPFLEENGRRLFLLYLKPIINGVGNYYIEARTRDMGRTDVIIDYRGKQYVCELKIWRGNAYHRRGQRQLLEYLDSYHLTVGYMLSFNFNRNKQVGVKKIWMNEKLLIEAVV